MLDTTTPELLYLLAADPVELAETVAGMRPADLAEATNMLPSDAAAHVVAALPFDLAVGVMDHPQLRHGPEIVQHIEPSLAGELIEAMAADQQADLFQELDRRARERLVTELSPETRRVLSELLRYPPESAGGIMTTEVLTVPDTWTVREAIRHIQEVAPQKETVYALYVVDAAQHLRHVASLRDLMSAEPDERVAHVGPQRKPLSVSPLTDREEVARLISKYNLLAVPVVDAAGRVLGVVTVDDVIDALVAEQTEDVQKFGGSEALDEPYMRISFLNMVKKRAGWLTALFLGEMLTATAMGHFEGEIQKAVVLALFIPLIISSGGNSGSQATSLIIRAMALKEVHLADWWRVALRELPSGLALGVILGVVGVVRIVLWQMIGWYDYGPHFLLVAITVGLALVGVVTWGSLMGSMLPFIIRRFGFDPASASAPFVATLVDVSGLVIYFSVAYVILNGTLL